MSEATTAEDQVVHSGRSTGQKSERFIAEDDADTENQAEPSQLNGTEQESEMTEADMAQDQVAPSEQSAAQAAKRTVVEVVAGAEPQALQSQSEDMKQSNLARQIEKILPEVYTDTLKSLGQRLFQLFQKLKQWLKF
jgi:uncharacterized protein YcbK (DUF882 family)